MNRFLGKQKRNIQIAVASLLVLTPSFSFAFPGAMDIGLFIFSLFAEIAGYAGVIMNIAIQELVIEMGDKMQFGIGASVENAWTIIRDVINIFFIFGLVYIGFKMILEGSGQHVKLIPSLIIGALLINFSLFFTKVIIDISNVAAVQIYQTALEVNNQAAYGQGNGSGESVPEGQEDQANKLIGISGSYMHIMGLKALISPDRNEAKDEENFTKLLGSSCTKTSTVSEGDFLANCSNNALLFFMIGSVFMIMAAYVFFMGAFLIVVRFITLVILMILSPVMFLGMAFPSPALQKFSRQWFSRLIGASFMAPIYFLFLYIGLAVGSRIGVDNGAGVNMFRAASGDYTALEGVLNLIIVVAFMMMAVTFARSMAKSSGGMVMDIADRGRLRAQKALMAGGRGITRRTGRGIAAGAGAAGGAAGGALVTRPLNRLSSRTTSRIEKWQAKTENQENALGKTMLGRGVARYGGGAVRAATKKGENARFAGGLTASERQAADRAYVKQTSGTKGSTEGAAKFTSTIEALNNKPDAAGMATGMADLKKSVKDMKFDKMSDGDIKGMMKSGTLTDRRVAVNLSKDQLKQLEETGALSPAQLKEIKDTQKAAYTQMAKVGYVTKSEGDDVNGQITSPAGVEQQNGLSAMTAANRRSIVSRPVKEVGEMDVDIFKQPEMLPYLTPKMVEERMRNGGVTSEDVATIGANVNAYLADKSTTKNVKKSWANWAERDGAQYAGQLGLQTSYEHEEQPAAPSTDSAAPAESEGRRKAKANDQANKEAKARGQEAQANKNRRKA